MHLKLSYVRPEGRTTNLGVTVDATALVGDLARALYRQDPAHDGAEAPSGLTLSVERRTAQATTSVLDPERNLVEAGLRSGSLIRLSRERPAASLGGDRGTAVARLRVLAGPDKGREFELPAGVSHIGRLPTCEISLSDPLVSKRHARIVVGESIGIVDEGSANGIEAGGVRVTKTLVGPADVLRLGDTLISVAGTRLAGTVEPSSPSIEFNRSPRVEPRFEPENFRTPVAPTRPNPMRFPVVAMVAPLIMGLVLYAVTRNLLSIVFIGLSPLLMLGMYLDQRLGAAKQLTQQKEDFDTTLRVVAGELTEAQERERAVRLDRTPSLMDLRRTVDLLGPLLWSRRPEAAGFLTVRLGVGSARSLCSIDHPDFSATALPSYLQRAREFARSFEDIDGVPVVGDLRSAGALGAAGPRGSVEGIARGLVFQLVALHSPAELVVTVFASPVSRTTWEWVEWLPHAGSVHSPLTGGHLADNQGSGRILVAELEDLVASRLDAELPLRGVPRGEVQVEKGIPRAEEHAVPPLPSVVVVVDDDAPVDRSRLIRLAETGPDVGVYVIWSATRVENLPSVCRTFVEAGAGHDGAVTGVVRHGMVSSPVTCETLDAPAAAAAALLLAPVVDAGVSVEDASDVPQSVSMLDLVGHRLGDDPEVVLERWRENGTLGGEDDGTPDSRRRRRAGDLRALVGSTGVAPMSLDLRTDGPHALVGGTTGSGKSEFLQSWVLGMAAAHSPRRVTFLFIDYKGGAAFADCVDLPHCVGLVTDLSQHLVRRALTSLRAEIRHREHLLNAKKAKDLITLEKTGDPDCPPSLVIVVDEFAALVQEIPEFVDGVVDVAQRGRSLGIHLVLATQRPAGVIKDNLRANTNLRIALRMADADDSTDVLGVPDAADFPPNIPGRAAAKTGPGRLTTFQSAYSGGHTSDVQTAPPVEVEELHFGSPIAWEPPLDGDTATVDEGPTDITRVVGSVSAAAQIAGIPAPRRPWLPELRATYNTAAIRWRHSDSRLLLGIRDAPADQQQPRVFYEPSREGNMAIYGTGGSGKSAALRQVAVAASLAATTAPVHIYGLDFGSSGLRMLEPLPTVGAVISGDDEERTARLMRELTATVDERAERYAAARASTIEEYRATAGGTREARIIVLVDGIGAFRDAYEHSTTAPWFSMFTQIAGDGRGVGVHVVVTGDRSNSVPTSLGSSVQKRFVLRLASEDEYLNLGVPRDVLDQTSPPGRAILGDDEMQFAILGGEANVSNQSREIERLADHLRGLGVTPAPGIRQLEERIPLDVLPPSVEQTDRDGSPVLLAPIGVADMTLGPTGIETRGTLMLAGTPGSGRTSVLLTIAQAVRRERPGRIRVLLSMRSVPQLAGEHWDATAVGGDAVAELCRGLVDDIRSGRTDAQGLAVVLHGLADFAMSPAEADLLPLIKEAVACGHFVVGESESSTWNQAYQLAQPFKSARVGLLLAPGDSDGDGLLGTPLGRVKRAEFPPGRGFYIRYGVATKLQVAMPMA
ncbi:MAG: FtsK/SpoIIIE domain-containing protein [Dietzia sp.]